MGRDNHDNNNVHNVCDKNGNTVLHHACRINHYKIVNDMLTNHMHLVTKRNVKGDLPLYLLCSIAREGDSNSMTDDVEHLEMIWRMLLPTQKMYLTNNLSEVGKMSSNGKNIGLPPYMFGRLGRTYILSKRRMKRTTYNIENKKFGIGTREPFFV